MSAPPPFPYAQPNLAATRTAGFNIEEMDKYFPIKDFDRVYLIDLCEPLLDVARRRFAARGWTNVQVLCQDATFFTLPEWGDSLVHARGAVRSASVPLPVLPRV